MAAGAKLTDIEIRGLTADSRNVEDGYLFAALPGTRLDGRTFIPEAWKRGAAAVLAPEGTRFKPPRRPVALLTDENPRRRLALMAARFFQVQPANVAAVTGTNGKTSVASFTRQIWEADGQRAASLGTLGLEPAVVPGPGGLTTPDPVALHHCLADLKRAGYEHLAIEASSIGLDQYRLDGLKVTAAAFTNLSRDHLDYHGDMTAYRTSKQQLFERLLVAGGAGTAVLNADAPESGIFAQCAEARRCHVLTYGRQGKDLQLLSAAPEGDGLRIEVLAFGKARTLRLPLAGLFQAHNALAALGLAVATGVEPETAVAALEGLRPVHGRLEKVGETPAGGQVYVDYAHTPDALDSALSSLRPHTAGRLVVVFGAGGDRDPGKRPLMGEAAARHADRVVVTDDNPRSEAPAAIRKAILAAAPGAEEVGSRGEAIRAAVAGLEAGDLLLIAGKGHETGQIVGAEVLPFDDCEEARAAIAALQGGAA